MLLQTLERLPGAATCFSVMAIFLMGITLFGASALPPDNRTSDEGAYIEGAHNLLDGGYANSKYQGEGHYLWHGPGLSLVLSPLVAVGAPVRVLRLVSPLAIVFAGYLLFRLLRRHVAAPIALLTGVLLCLYWPNWRLLPQVYVEPLSLLLTIAALLALANAIRDDNMRWAVASGACFGMLALARPEYGYLILAGLVAAGIMLIVRHSRRDGLFAIVAAVSIAVCIPWLAYTYSLTDRPLYWSSSGGSSLYWMSSPLPGETGSWFGARDVAERPELAPHRAFFASISKLPQPAYDRALQRQAVDYIRDHPGTYGEHLVANVGRLFFQYPTSFEAYGVGRAILYFVPDATLLALAAAAAVFLRRRRVRIPATIVPVLVFGVVNIVLHLPGSAYVRFAAPSVPAALSLIALALQQHMYGAPRARPDAPR